MGNYWSDHTTPDGNGDGIVDIQYNITTDIADGLPLTNPNFDLDRPEVLFTNLTSGLIDRSYIRIQGQAFDEYGIESMKLNGTGYDWKEITGSDIMPAILEKGKHTFTLFAEDTNGLFSFSEINLTLEDDHPLLNIDSIVEGSFIEDDPVIVNWEIPDYFPVHKQNFTLDGEWSIIGNDIRTRSLDIEGGHHTISLEIQDDLKTQVKVKREFWIDRNAPEIFLEGPAVGVVLSNRMVHFNFKVVEEVGIDEIAFRFDSEEWIELEEFGTIERLLDEGEHLLEIRASDIAGHLTEIEIPFEIRTENIVQVNSPLNGTFFSTDKLELDWEYLGPFVWTEALLRVGLKNDFIPIYDFQKTEMSFPKDGEYQITLKLKDELDNFVQSEIWVIKDSVAPKAGFIGIDEGEHLARTSVKLQWNAVDSCGIERYLIDIDSGGWEDKGLDTELTIEMEEGEHTARIKAFDLAGNHHESWLSFIIDTTPPEISFTHDTENIRINPRIKLEWESSDNFGITEMELIIQGRDSKNVLEENELNVVITEDGVYAIMLNATDMAGNKASISSTITVDLTPPRASWTSDIISITREGKITLEWDIEEQIGIDAISLKIGENTIALDTAERSKQLEFEEGAHSISLKVADVAGWIHELDYPNGIIVDRSEPTLIIKESSSVKDGIATIGWVSEDEFSEIESVWISIDGEEFFEVEADSFSTARLGSGDHSITIRVVDAAGNMKEDTWTFTVTEEKTSDAGDEGGFPLLLVAVIILVVIGGGTGVFLFLKMRKKGGQEEYDDVETGTMNKKLSGRNGLALPNIPAPVDQLSDQRNPELPSVQTYQRPLQGYQVANSGEKSGISPPVSRSSKENNADGSPPLLGG
ncbi:MAG: hypothetical protein ACMUIE_10205 [Thermoplasmatota archaeon]